MPTMRDRFTNVTGALLDANERLALVLADIGVSGFAQTGAVERHPDRVVNVGIREQAMVGVAAGFALEGFRPVVHTYAPFLVERAFEQLKLDFGHQGVGGVFVSVGASYDAAGAGRTHHCPGDVALLRTLPGWRIHVPGHPDEVEALLRAAAGGDGCVYVRLAEDVNASPQPVDGPGFTAVRRGSRRAPSIVAVGPMLDRVLEATSGMDTGVVYTATPQPLDASALRALLGAPEVVVVEPCLEGTSAAALSAALADRPHRLLAIGVPNREHRRYGTRGEHDAANGLDARGIRARIEQFLAERGRAA